MLHMYTPWELRNATAADWDDIFEVAIEENCRVWKHADGSVAIASGMGMADWCDRNDSNWSDWTEVEAPAHYRQG